MAEADQSFSLIDRRTLDTEMTALRMELFDLAWTHRFKDESALAESFFIRHYLDENGTIDTWDITGEYNQAIARSAVKDEKNEQMGKT